VSIDFGLEQTMPVSLAVYSLSGALLERMDAAAREPGAYRIVWDSAGRNGQAVSGGLYVLRLRLGDLLYEGVATVR
jgi:hypothetical protein